jgi:hypothetical protein
MMLTYSKCHNIKIDGDEFTSGILGLDWFPSSASAGQKAKYEYDVVAVLDKIIASWTGWAVIDEIFYRSQWMRVQPYHPTPETGKFNAYAMPTNLASATLAGTVARDPYGALPGPGQPRTTGTGIGSNVIVKFSATTFAQPGAPTGPSTSPHEILLHEMVHGLRQMAGRSVREPITANPGMNNYEEFVAITISNMYRSELGLSPLRADHVGFLPLTGPTTDLGTFKATYSSWLVDMDIEQPRLCQHLRQVKCTFNPLS